MCLFSCLFCVRVESLLTQITVLSEFSKSNTQQVMNLKVLYLAQKKLKSFETFMTYEIHSFQQCVSISINVNNF